MGRKKKIKKIKKNKKKEKFLTKKLVNQNTFKSSNEEKVEIKKIKKQPNEKRIYSIKDYVVYPKHGVGKIVSIDKPK